MQKKDIKKSVGEDCYTTWLRIMSQFGIQENKYLAQRIFQMTGRVYRHWELTRWLNRSRDVPKIAFDCMVLDVFFYCTFNQEILRPKDKETDELMHAFLGRRKKL